MMDDIDDAAVRWVMMGEIIGSLLATAAQDTDVAFLRAITVGKGRGMAARAAAEVKDSGGP